MVMKQEITQHKVQKSRDSKKKKKPLQVTTKVTTRKIGRILYAVQTKLTQILLDAEDFEDTDNCMVARALQDPLVKKVIFKNLKCDGIKLVHKDSKEPIYRRETTLIGEKGDRALNESPDHDETQLDLDPEEAELQLDNEARVQIDKSVKDYIRRNSKL